MWLCFVLSRSAALPAPGDFGTAPPKRRRARRRSLYAAPLALNPEAGGLQEPGAAADLRSHQLGPDRPQGGAQAAGGVPEPGAEPVGAAPLRQPGGAARALGGVGALRRAQPAHHGRGAPLELGPEREGAAGARGHEARGGAAAHRGPGRREHRGGRLRQEPHAGTDRERRRVRLRREQAGPAGPGEPDGRRAQPHPDPVQRAADLQAGLRGRVQHGHGLQGQPLLLRVPRVRPAGPQFRREVHRAGAAHRVRLRAAAAAPGALRGAHQGRAGAARAQRRGARRGLRGQPHPGAGFPEARLLLGLRRLRAPGPRGAEGRDGSAAGEALRLPRARRRADLRRIHLLLRRQRDRRTVLLGRHQHFPGIHHVPQGGAGPVRVEDPQPGLREELRHRGGRREHHQLGALAHLRGAGLRGPQAQVVHGGAGGENAGRDLHGAGGHGLFPLPGDRPGRVGGGAGEAAEAPGVQPPHPLRGPHPHPHPDPDPDPAPPSRPPFSLPVPAFPALRGVTPARIPGFWNSRGPPDLPARPAPPFVGSALELFYLVLYFSAAFFTVSRFSSPQSLWLPARDRSGDPIPPWDPCRDLGSRKSSCPHLVFPPVFPFFPPYSHFFPPEFPFLAGFPYFGCYNSRISRLPPPPASAGIPDPIPAAFPASPPRPRPPRGHLRDHEGSPKGIFFFFFPGNSGWGWFVFPPGGWFGPGSAGIPAFPHPQFPPCQVTVLESRGAFRSRARLCPAPFPLPSGRF